MARSVYEGLSDEDVDEVETRDTANQNRRRTHSRRDHPHFPDQEDLVQRWTYLKITPQGITWGFMNGMRPRGMLLFEGKLESDTLTGLEHFGGINFKLPDGSSPPPLYFSFKRGSR